MGTRLLVHRSDEEVKDLLAVIPCGIEGLTKRIVVGQILDTRDEGVGRCGVDLGDGCRGWCRLRRCEPTLAERGDGGRSDAKTYGLLPGDFLIAHVDGPFP